MILKDKAVRYAEDVLSGKEITTDEVKIQCKWFLEDLKLQENADFEFYFYEKALRKIEKLLMLLYFATGLNVVGLSILDGLHDFQAFFIANIFGWRFKSDKQKFRYRDIILFIPRKNAKTFICAVIIILLMLTEQNFSEFYSICLDRTLAGEVKKAITQILDASKAVAKYFKVPKALSGMIVCKLTNSFYQARTAEANRNNSIRPSAFIADEIGAFRDYKNVNAMKSGQLNIKNPLRFKLTTAYAESESIMIDELEYIRKVYEDVHEDKRMFALIYYAKDEDKWTEKGIQTANPLRIEENYNEIRDNMKTALAKPAEQTEYLTKHLNIFVQSSTGTKYIDISKFIKGRLDNIDFKGKIVVVGVDASLTTDLTAVTIMFREGDRFYFHSHAFLPRNTLPLRREKIDYELMEKQGYCTITDGDIVDYRAIEAYIRSIEEEFECMIKTIVMDPFNLVEMGQKLSEDYEVIMLKQSYTNLTPALKSFRDNVYDGKVFYIKNRVLDWCASNAVTTKPDKYENFLLDKGNRNKERIDMLVASIFAYTQLYLQDYRVPELTEDYINDWFKTS